MAGSSQEEAPSLLPFVSFFSRGDGSVCKLTGKQVHDKLSGSILFNVTAESMQWSGMSVK